MQRSAAAAAARPSPSRSRRRTRSHRSGRRQAQVGEGALPLLRNAAAASRSASRTTASSRRRPIRSPRSTAASTASRATTSTKIMYGADRLTTPLLRMKNGRYDKNGEFAPVSWDRAFDEMAAQWKRVLKEKGPDRRRHVRLGPVDGLGGLRRAEAHEGGLPHQQPRPQRAPLHGERGGGLHAHVRHRRADGLLRRHRGRQRVRAVGLEHGGDASGAVDAA